MGSYIIYLLIVLKVQMFHLSFYIIKYLVFLFAIIINAQNYNPYNVIYKYKKFFIQTLLMCSRYIMCLLSFKE